jgi:UDP-2,4-diacetamido-2,4,6-trideoxy-beta-L-altropyranose hydrolase
MTARALFVCDAGPVAGGGHVMRSVTIARAMQDLGATPLFLAPPAVAALLDTFAPDIATTPAANGEPARLVAAARRQTDVDLLVFDHYGLDADDQAAASGGRATAVIDDLANRPLHADLLLDPGLDRVAEDYAPWVQEAAPKLLGPMFAPVRPAFAAAREASIARRLEPGPARRILVALGLGDLGGVTGRVLEIILPMLRDEAVDVVLGKSAPSLSAVKALAADDRRVSLHIDSREMAELTAAADIAIGAGGSSSWERCVLGLPAIMLILADNQRAAASGLESRGAALALDAHGAGFQGALEDDLGRLLFDDDLRRGMAVAAADICDGQGAGRVAGAMLELARQRAAP